MKAEKRFFRHFCSSLGVGGVLYYTGFLAANGRHCTLEQVRLLFPLNRCFNENTQIFDWKFEGASGGSPELRLCAEGYRILCPGPRGRSACSGLPEAGAPSAVVLGSPDSGSDFCQACKFDGMACLQQDPRSQNPWNALHLYVTPLHPNLLHHPTHQPSSPGTPPAIS